MCTNAEIKPYRKWVNQQVYQFLGKLPANVEADDLTQAALIGLADAIDRFDPSQGVQFTSFASQRVRGAMLDELRAADWAPRGLRSDERKIDTAYSHLLTYLGRRPLESEVAAHLGLPLAEYQAKVDNRVAALIAHLEDTKTVRGEDGESLTHQYPCDESFDPQVRLADTQNQEALAKAVLKLPERLRELLAMRYEQDLSFLQIADAFGVTESRACQLHKEAVARLRSGVKAARFV